jgi:hypothetical protein
MAETLPLAVCDECGAIYPFRPQAEEIGDGVARTFVVCPSGHQVTISYTNQALTDEAMRLERRRLRATTPAARRGLEKAAARLRRRFDAFNRDMGVRGSMQYIVRSGDGYFVQFVNDTPEMTSDSVCATRLAENAAKKVVNRLDSLGFAGELVKVTVGRMKSVGG